MAKSNGKLSEKRVADWFTAMDFDGQQATLAKLSDLHGSVKEDKIRALRQELAQLEGGGSSISGRKKWEQKAVILSEMDGKRLVRCKQNTAIQSLAKHGQAAGGWHVGWPKRSPTARKRTST